MKATINPAYPACLQEISAASFPSQQRLPVYGLGPAASSSYIQIHLSMHPKPTQRLATYPTPCAHARRLSTCCHITHASSSVSGGCGVPLGELSHSMCLNLLLTSLSLICARVSFFFFFALNFISELSSAPEFAAEAAALLTALLTLLDPGRESSKRSSETARWPLCITRPSATCHCSGHSAPTNSSLCEILK
jgi:hypothetical protein